MDWPPLSPGLNIIEAVCDHLHREWNKKAANIQKKSFECLSGSLGIFRLCKSWPSGFLECTAFPFIFAPFNKLLQVSLIFFLSNCRNQRWLKIFVHLIKKNITCWNNSYCNLYLFFHRWLNTSTQSSYKMQGTTSLTVYLWADCDLWTHVAWAALNMPAHQEQSSNSNLFPPSTLQSQDAAYHFIGPVPLYTLLLAHTHMQTCGRPIRSSTRPKVICHVHDKLYPLQFIAYRDF